MLRLTGLAATIALLLLLAWGAVSGAVRQFPHARTPGQQVETALQLAAGVLSVLVLVTLLRLRSWRRPIHIAWAVSLVAAAGLSGVVWGPPMPLVAVAFVAAASLLAWAVGSAVRRAPAMLGVPERPGPLARDAGRRGGG